jgi:hypothetical protein
MVVTKKKSVASRVATELFSGYKCVCNSVFSDASRVATQLFAPVTSVVASELSFD